MPALMLFLAVLSLAAPAQAGSGWSQTPREDGTTIDWRLDRPDGLAHRGLIVLAQGTGCTSVEHNRSFDLVESSFPGFALLTVEKRGVAPGDRPEDDQEGCGAAFHENHTKSHRVDDYLAVLGHLRDTKRWDGRLVLVGGSEGGQVVAQLSEPSGADAAIMLVSGGGTTFGEAVKLFMQSEMDILGVPEEVRPSIDDIYDDIRANPDSTELWAGHSYRYWADSIDRRGVDDMLRTDASLLMIHAGRDRSVATQTARPVPDIFAARGRCNLTYWEFPGYDHAMLEADGTSRMADVLAKAAAWVEAEPADARGRACAQPNFDAGTTLGALPVDGTKRKGG